MSTNSDTSPFIRCSLIPLPQRSSFNISILKFFIKICFQPSALLSRAVLNCVTCLSSSSLTAVSGTGTDLGTTRNMISQLLVYFGFREQWYRCRLLCQVGSCYLYGRRRKHFCRRQGTQSPLWQLEEEVWFYSGCGCQIYLESSHVSSLFSYVAMAIFIIVWYPYQGSWLISLK